MTQSVENDAPQITARLRAAIDDTIMRAPHAPDCVTFDRGYTGPRLCSCFKDDLRLAMAEAYSVIPPGT